MMINMYYVKTETLGISPLYKQSKPTPTLMIIAKMCLVLLINH